MMSDDAVDKTGSLRALVERWREASRLNVAMCNALNDGETSKIVYEIRADELAKLATELERALDALPSWSGAELLDKLRRELRKVNDHLDDAQNRVEQALDGLGDVVRP